jgi:hypothetical protein
MQESDWFLHALLQHCIPALMLLSTMVACVNAQPECIVTVGTNRRTQLVQTQPREPVHNGPTSSSATRREAAGGLGVRRQAGAEGVDWPGRARAWRARAGKPQGSQRAGVLRVSDSVCRHGPTRPELRVQGHQPRARRLGIMIEAPP